MPTLAQAEKARTASQFENARHIYGTLLRNKSLQKEEKAEILLGLADVERIRGYFPEALNHYRQAETLLKGMDPVAAIDAQVGWALAARASGQPQAALQKLWKSLAFYRKERDMEGEAFVRWALGGTLRIAGDMKKGLRELLNSLGLFKKLKNSEGLSYTCCALGGLYRMLGDYASSGRYYREANHRMRQRGDTFGIAYSYCGLGNVERMAGRFRQALPFYKKAEKLYGKIGDRVSYAYTLWSLGTTYKMLGHYSKAAECFYKADKLFIQTGDTRGRIYVHQGLSEIRILIPRSSKSISKKLRTYMNDENNRLDLKEFSWESLHEKALIYFMFIDIGKIFSKALSNKVPTSQITNLEKANTGALKELKDLYRKTGSRFFPKSIPVNWP